MPTPEPTTAQPKISQKMILRTAILLFVLAIMFVGYRYVESQHGDFNFGDANSSGLISAIQTKDNGQEAVIIHPDGAITGTAAWKDGVSDRDVVWQPDGRFLYFVSDRTGNTYHLYRWNPAQDSADQMTGGTRGRSAPSFPADDATDAADYMLMICGGVIQGFDPKRKITPQILPKPTANITQSTDVEESGSEGEFQALYGKIGTAFRSARYIKGNRFIVAVIERDNGEVLIAQEVEPKDGKPHPFSIIAGGHIDYDVNPKDGSVVFTVQNFQFPDPDHVPTEFIKNNKVTRPVNHAIGMFDPDNPGLVMIGRRMDDKVAFGAPAISPDGASVLLTEGPYDPTTQSMQSQQMISCPIKQQGLQMNSTVVRGEVYEPSWSPDGSKIVFVMRNHGKRDIYTMSSDGSSQTDLTSGKGDFSFPRFSPQVKADK